MRSLEESYTKERDDQLASIKKSKLPIYTLTQLILYFTFSISLKMYNFLDWNWWMQVLYVLITLLLIYVLHKEFSNLTQQCIEDFEQKIKGLEK